MATKYEIPEEVSEKLLETLGQEVEMKTFKTSVKEEQPQKTITIDRSVNVICVGDHIAGVGKDVFIKDYLHWPPRKSALLYAGLSVKTMTWKRSKKHKPISVQLKLFEIAEQARFGNMLRAYIKDSRGALVFWGTGNPASLDGVTKWLTELKKICPLIPCVLITDNVTNETRQWIGPGKIFESESALERFCKVHGFLGHFEINSRDQKSGEKSVFGQAVNCLLQEIFKNEKIEFEKKKKEEEERTWMVRMWNSIRPRK